MLGLRSAAFHRSVRRVLWSTACCGLLLTVTPAGLLARFSADHGEVPTELQGARFSPSIAPMVSHVRLRNQITLTWSAVAISSGYTVLYHVTRIPVAGSPIQICTGATAPVTAGGSVSCTEAIPGANPNDRYTEQPYVTYLGQMTWSIPASVPA